MPRTRGDIELDITRLAGSYSSGTCLDCKKIVPRGSQKEVNGYDICWGCYVKDADPLKNRLMFLVNQLEIEIAWEAKQQQR